MSKQVKPYRYYDTPDGQDLIKKLWCVMKPATAVAVGIGTHDVMLYSKPKGYMATLGRFVYIAIPVFGMTTVFVVGSNILANIRGKDDAWNWAFAGAAAGSILGAWRQSSQVGVISAGIFGLAAAGKKQALINGVVLTPDLSKPRMHGGVMAVRHDFSLLEDKTGEWKKKYMQ